MAENPMFEIGRNDQRNNQGVHEAYLGVIDPKGVREALDILIQKLGGNEKMKIAVDTAYGTEFVSRVFGKKYSPDFADTFNSMFSAFQQAKAGNVDELRKKLGFPMGTLPSNVEQPENTVVPASIVPNSLADAVPGRSRSDLSIAGALSGKENSVMASVKKRNGIINNVGQ